MIHVRLALVRTTFTEQRKINSADNGNRLLTAVLEPLSWKGPTVGAVANNGGNQNNLGRIGIGTQPKLPIIIRSKVEMT